MEIDKHPVENTFKKQIDFIKNPLYAGHYIRTFSGTYINVFNIENELNNINIEDIAHSLSQQCRFSGHIQSYYSVAQHCLHVASLLPDEFKFEGLMHDASEAYLVDIPAPIKPKLTEYKLIEFRVMDSIAKKYDFNHPFNIAIKNADLLALEFEWNNLMIANNLESIEIPKVKNEFIKRFYEYSELKRKRY